MYAELTEALRWESPMANAAHARATLHRNAGRRFDQFSSRFESERGKEARRIIARLRSLSEDRQDAVIASPQGFYAASRGCPTDVAQAFFDGAVTVEEIRAGEPGPESSSPCWAALGDEAYAFAKDEGWIREFSAVKASGFLPIDTRCPVTRGEAPGMATRSAPIPQAEEPKIVGRLVDTIGLIEAASTATLQLFRDFVRVIVAREVPQERMFYAGGARVTPGRIIVNNVFGAGGIERVADALVHEAIHCAIDHCELEQPIVIALGVEDRIESPWTGRSLDLNTFVQACFVWYGLANFWEHVDRRHDLRTESSSALLAQARQGFERSDPTLALEPHRRVLHPALIDAMQGMRAFA